MLGLRPRLRARNSLFDLLSPNRSYPSSRLNSPWSSSSEDEPEELPTLSLSALPSSLPISSAGPDYLPILSPSMPPVSLAAEIDGSDDLEKLISFLNLAEKVRKEKPGIRRGTIWYVTFSSNCFSHDWRRDNTVPSADMADKAQYIPFQG